MCCSGDSNQLELWLPARTADLTDEIRPYVMGDKRLNSDWQFYPVPLKLPDGKSSGNRTFSPYFLCSLFFYPKKEEKKHFSFLPSFYSNAASSAVFFPPYGTPVLYPPFFLWGGKKEKRQQKEQQWRLGQLTLPYTDNLKNTKIVVY